MVTVRCRWPWRSNSFSSLLCPPIHTFLSSVTAMSYRRALYFSSEGNPESIIQDTKGTSSIFLSVATSQSSFLSVTSTFRSGVFFYVSKIGLQIIFINLAFTECWKCMMSNLFNGFLFFQNRPKCLHLLNII